VLEKILQLAGSSPGGIRSVLPRIDHDRVRYFAAFWTRPDLDLDPPGLGGGSTEWIRDLALQFQAAFEVDANANSGGR
jgi:hypothetical protein